MPFPSVDCEKFAIIGMGLRLPPNSNSLSAFWRFLMRGGNALKPVKKDRWDWRQFYDDDPKRPGKSYAPKAAFLDADIRQFDPLAFGISPREARCLDPQQRLLLEATWEAFEDAGVPLEAVSGSSTGVFVGGFCLDHLVLQMQPENRHLVDAHSPGGVTMTVLSNRISHVFNLRGPSLTLDTACSSSLVSVHYACQSLRLRECSMVLAGGVNVMSRPDFPILMSKGHFLSPHGECHAFDESAAGYARGEGAGMLLIKRYDDAIADGDQIHAVIRGSGVNQDGHTDGISLPNSEAQENLIRRVYQSAGVAPADVDYVEAHGTGTQAGDPAELRALHAHFSEGRPADRKLLVGSVKTNIGHLEAAAGVAGIIKTVAVLKHRLVPRNLHFKKPNPRIPFDQYCLTVASENTALPGQEEKPVLLAGVNSFGYGGTNAHVILESAPVRESVSAPEEKGALRLIPLSARSEVALRDLAGKYAFQLGQGLGGTLSDLAYTTAFRRSHLEKRCAALAATPEELREQFIAASTGQPHEGVCVSGGSADSPGGLVFVYTGMGPQWWAMGQELFREEPIVRATIEEIDEIFVSLAGWSLKEAMLATEADSRMARTEVAQPANFALQVALTRLWESRGIRPAAVVGHSVGEVSSSYAAGVYSLEEAVRISFYRSRLQQTTAGQGSMLAVGLPEAEAEALIAGRGGISIAAVNSFQAVTLSGNAGELQQVASILEKDGVFNKFLRVEVAYHSPQMDPLREPILEALAGLSPKPQRIPLYSTVHGKVVDSDEWDAEYWWHNVREPVRFAHAIQALFEAGFRSFLEIGPHPVLGNSIRECAAHLERRVSCFASLKRKEPERRSLLSAAAQLYCAGYDLDWTALTAAKGKLLPAPPYPWQRQVYWNESERSMMNRLGLPGSVYLNRTVLAPRPCWEVEINRNYFPFLFDHGVQNQTVFAGMGYVEAAITLGLHVTGASSLVLDNISFEKVLIVDYSKLQYLVTEYDAEAGRFSISSRVEGEEESVQRQCRGRLAPRMEAASEAMDLRELKKKCPQPVTVESFYEDLTRRGLHYGPAFRPTTNIHVGSGCFLVEIDTSAVEGQDTHPLHPTLFDAAIQPVLYCAGGSRLYVPFSIKRFHFHSRPGGKPCFAYGKITSQSDTMIVADVWLMNADGQVHAHACQMSCQAIETGAQQTGADMLYRWIWRTEPLRSTRSEKNGTGMLVVQFGREPGKVARQIAQQHPGARMAMLDISEGGFGEQQLELVLSNPAHADCSKWIVLLEAATDPVRSECVRKTSEAIAGLMKCLVRSASNHDVTLVTKRSKAVLEGDTVDAALAPASALGLLAQNECERLAVRSIDFEESDALAIAEAVLAEVGAQSAGDIAYRAGKRYECVLERIELDEDEAEPVMSRVEEPVELKTGVKGKADSLVYIPAQRREPAEGEIEIRIHRTALNYKDVLKLDGHIHPLVLENTFWGTDLGMECSGVVVRAGARSGFQPGEEVVTILPGAFRTYATVPSTFAVKIPETLGMEAGAIPVVYTTAYRGLVEIARLQQGERILIHHGTGGLGMAAIQIAQWVGAEIFATAGSEEKREYLRNAGIRHVYSSRTLDFGPEILRDTEGEGIDVVIGAQTGQAMHVNLGLLRMGGRYIEVGKKDIAEDNDLPLRAFDRNLLFASVDIDRLAKERPEVIQKTMRSVFAHFAKGDFKPPQVNTVPASAIAEAFESMERSRHMGKILVDFATGEVPVQKVKEAKPLVRKEGCYLITGGTSGFGASTGRWLAAQGAGRIVLASRSGAKAPGTAELRAEIERCGTAVEVISLDVANAEAVSAAVKELSNGPVPLRGIIHGAMVLEDRMLSELSEESFRKVFLPKAAGALNLVEAVAEGTELDFIVFYSSISAMVGNRGQASYVAANAVLDGLAQALRAKGIPAVSLNWGALAESGVVARDEHLGGLLASSGITGLPDQAAFDALAAALRGSAAQLGAFLVDWQLWHDAHPRLADDPRFREQRIRSQGSESGGVADELRRSLAEVSREQRLRTLEDHLQDVLARTLKMTKENISKNRRLNEMGVDSLMVLELSLGIKERVGVNFSAMEFLKGPTIEQLASAAESKLWNN